MTKKEALIAIKALRDQINANEKAYCDADAYRWENAVCYQLDAASDVIEFGATDNQ